jgi:hypothetical protein
MRGIVEIAHDGDKFNYSSDQPQTVDTRHFTDKHLAGRYHAEATAQLQVLIDGLKTSSALTRICATRLMLRLLCQ